MGTVDFQQLTGVQSSLQISADYLFAGNVIGEMGLLTDSVRNASITCETTVQVKCYHKCMNVFNELKGNSLS